MKDWEREIKLESKATILGVALEEFRKRERLTYGMMSMILGMPLSNYYSFVRGSSIPNGKTITDIIHWMMQDYNPEDFKGIMPISSISNAPQKHHENVATSNNHTEVLA